MTTRVPRRLYKYRAFNANTLRLLSEAEMYYADPSRFNDPMDCDPLIAVDTDLKTLEKVCYRMLVLDRGKDKALQRMQNHRYMSTEHGDYKSDPDANYCYVQGLRLDVRSMLLAEMGKHGVISLAARWSCPLMWSHYADEHRGLCIEYSTADHHCTSLLPVNYNTTGAITISDIYRWKIDKAPEAERKIREAFFYSKAREWKYEREWRDVRKGAGACESTFRSITAVYFGTRCDSAVFTAVVKLFDDPRSKVKFFNLYRHESSFLLKRSPVDVEDIAACGVRTPVSWDFENLDSPEPPVSGIPAT